MYTLRTTGQTGSKEPLWFHAKYTWFFGQVDSSWNHWVLNQTSRCQVESFEHFCYFYIRQYTVCSLKDSNQDAFNWFDIELKVVLVVRQSNELHIGSI